MTKLLLISIIFAGITLLLNPHAACCPVSNPFQMDQAMASGVHQDVRGPSSPDPSIQVGTRAASPISANLSCSFSRGGLSANSLISLTAVASVPVQPGKPFWVSAAVPENNIPQSASIRALRKPPRI